MTDITLEGPAVGAFADATQAQKAVAALQQAGYRNDQIGIVSRHSVEGTPFSGSDEPQRGRVQEGAVAGMAVGAGLSAVCGGMLWGVSALSGVVPGIGPVVVGGTLAILGSAAAAGAMAARLGGALKGLGVTEDDAKFYESELKAGRTIITVQGANSEDAQQILRAHGAYEGETGPQ